MSTAGHNIISMCLFMWRARWSDLLKARSHSLHWKGLSPVCFLQTG